MRALAAHGVGQARPVLNLDPADRVGVVTGPGLWRHGKHPRIESSSAATAALEQDVGKRGGDALEDVVDAKHLPVVDLAL